MFSRQRLSDVSQPLLTGGSLVSTPASETRAVEADAELSRTTARLSELEARVQQLEEQSVEMQRFVAEQVKAAVQAAVEQAQVAAKVVDTTALVAAAQEQTSVDESAVPSGGESYLGSVVRAVGLRTRNR